MTPYPGSRGLFSYLDESAFTVAQATCKDHPFDRLGAVLRIPSKEVDSVFYRGAVKNRELRHGFPKL